MVGAKTASESSSVRSETRGRFRSRGFIQFRLMVDQQALPMPTAGSGDLVSSDDEIVYSPQSRDFRSEKRYGGGQANALYIFNLKTNAAKRITEGPQCDTRSDVDWRHDLLQLGSRRSFQSVRLQRLKRQEPRKLQPTGNGTCVGPVQTTKVRSFMS